MMNKNNLTIEYAFDEALVRLRNGERLVEVVQDYSPELHTELTELLSFSEIGFAVPKQVIPTPIKEFRYKEKTSWFSSIHISRLVAVPLVMVFVLSGTSALAFGASNSLPGDKLYSLKRATEKARLNLALSEEKIAQIQLELTQRRLDEVKIALDSNDVEQETKALAALKAQTEETFASVTSVAAAKALTEKDESLLKDLVAITKEQKTVLASVPERSAESKEANETAILLASENSKTLAKISASVYEQTALESPENIAITGEIAWASSQNIAVEKNIFAITNETIVVNAEGDTVSSEKIEPGKVTVVGSKSDRGLEAKQIQLIDDEPVVAVKKEAETEKSTPEVKGDATVTPTVVTPPVVRKPVVTKSADEPKEEEQQPSEEELKEIEQNTAHGGFILEPDSEQYAP